MAKDEQDKQNPEAVGRQVRRETRPKWNAEEKNRIVLEGLRGESSTRQLEALVRFSTCVLPSAMLVADVDFPTPPL